MTVKLCAMCACEIEKMVDPFTGAVWDEGHNGRPIVDGRVCNTCNGIVIMQRIMDMRGEKRGD